MNAQTLQNSTSLYGIVPMTPSERRLGRYMRTDDRHNTSTGGDSNQAPNNQGSENNDSGGTPANQNNGGQEPDVGENFWSDPSPDTNRSAPSGESAGGGSPSGGSPNQQQDAGKAFATALSELKFGEVFTPEAIKKLNDESDASLFNQGLQALGQDAVRQSVLMSARLMQQVTTQIREEVKQEIQNSLGQRDAQTDLATEIPSYKNPKVRPVIDQIFAQAQKHHPKDRAKAIELTKSMLKIQMDTMGPDFGITTPPNGPDDQLRSDTNWEKELLGIGD